MTYTPYSKQMMVRVVTDNYMTDIMNDIDINGDHILDDMIGMTILQKLFY